MPVDIRGLSFELPDGRPLFTDPKNPVPLNLTLQRGLTALVGPNGTGKTTFARLLSGAISPTRGSITHTAPVKLFAQRETPPDIPVAEYLGADVWTHSAANPASKRLLAALLSEIPEDASCSTLSGGQWMRIRLARITTGTILFDEPTNNLDYDGRDAVYDFLKYRADSSEITLLISHDRAALSLCGATLEISSRGITRYGGGWEFYSETRDRERDRLNEALAEAAKHHNNTEDAGRAKRDKQEKRNRRGAAAASHGGQAKILLGARKRAAQATTGKVSILSATKTGQAVNELQNAIDALKIDPVLYARLSGRALPSQKLIAEANGFNLHYANRGWTFARDLDFTWRGNQRIALKGRNGSGKTTLVRALLNDLPKGCEQRGVLKSNSLHTLYLDQTGSGLDEDRSVLENVKAVSNAPEAEIRNELARFLFLGEAAFQRVGTLSGGERLRATLARGFLGSRQPEMLVLDEPTNNLDLAGIAYLEKVVAEFSGPVLVISHDETFLKACRLDGILTL